MREFLKQPIPELMTAYQFISKAADAHLSGDAEGAKSHFASANCPAAWQWLNSAWVDVVQHVVTRKPDGDTRMIPKSERDPDRGISRPVREAVLERDGFECRYCGLPVIHADIRKIAHALYPEEVPWNSRVAREQHAGFQALWLQFDHVEPHSHGGRSTPENVVVSCALCNFGKDRHTLRQLGLADPRDRPPRGSGFDGVERLRTAEGGRKSAAPPRENGGASARRPASEVQDFFFPGAWISMGYVNIPPIAGKSRWFRIGGEVSARPATCGDAEGVIVTCPPSHIRRRGLNVSDHLDDKAGP